MSGKHTIPVACFVVLAIFMTYAAISPPLPPTAFSPSSSGRGPGEGPGAVSRLIRHANPLPAGEGIRKLTQRTPLGGKSWLGRARKLWLIYSNWSVAYGAAQLHAAEPTLLRASIAKPGPVIVGEHMTMIVELLTATTFANAPIFELPKIPGAILMQIEPRPILGTEEIDGESYTLQRHELSLFVMQPGMAQIPPFIVRFESSPRFGENPIEYCLTTPALQWRHSGASDGCVLPRWSADTCGARRVRPAFLQSYSRPVGPATPWQHIMDCSDG
jgi:hypothetical protein